MKSPESPVETKSEIPLIPNRQERNHAEQVIAKLGNLTKLNPEQEGNLKFARDIQSRSGTVRNLIGGVGILVGVLGLVQVVRSSSDKDNTAPQATSVSEGKPKKEQVAGSELKNPEEKEALVDDLIVKVEAGADHLKQLLEAKLELVKDEKLKHQLMQPFRLVDLNRANPNKNSPRFHRTAMEQGLTEVKQENGSWFGYGSRVNIKFAASYGAPNREMGISSEFDPEKVMNLLVLYHELRHVMQDNQLRDGIHSRKDFDDYIAVYTKKIDGKPISPVVEESSAYLYEIEALNVLLDGELRAAILDKKPFDLEKARIQLKIQRDDKSSLNMLDLLVEMARSYYLSGSNMNGLHKPFTDKIVQLTRKHAGDMSFVERIDSHGMRLYR